MLTGAARATAAEPSQYTVTPPKFTVRAAGRSCTVDADLYRPDGVDAQHPAPAVLATDGFGGSKPDGSTEAIGKAFASRGHGPLQPRRSVDRRGRRGPGACAPGSVMNSRTGARAREGPEESP